jgi:hypothetical protein
VGHFAYLLAVVTRPLEEQFVRVVHVADGAKGKLEVGVEFLKTPPILAHLLPPDGWTPKDPEITADTF